MESWVHQIAIVPRIIGKSKKTYFAAADHGDADSRKKSTSADCIFGTHTMGASRSPAISRHCTGTTAISRSIICVLLAYGASLPTVRTVDGTTTPSTSSARGAGFRPTSTIDDFVALRGGAAATLGCPMRRRMRRT